MYWSMWSKWYLYRMLHAMLDDVLPSVYMIFFPCPCPGPKAPASKRRTEDDNGGELTDLYCCLLRVLCHTSIPADAESHPKKRQRSEEVKHVDDSRGTHVCEREIVH